METERFHMLGHPGNPETAGSQVVEAEWVDCWAGFMSRAVSDRHCEGLDPGRNMDSPQPFLLLLLHDQLLTQL